MEAAPGFEPGVKDLQSHALPLGYAALFCENGASNRNRTDDLILTMDALYLLSYGGESGSLNRIRTCDRPINSRALYQLSYQGINGGDKRIRTADPLLARQVLYQLSYTPMSGAEGGTRTHKITILSRARMPIPSLRQMVEREGFEPSKLTQRIYSPPHLATLVPLRMKLVAAKGFEPPTLRV